jgi:hypothetical protein
MATDSPATVDVPPPPPPPPPPETATQSKADALDRAGTRSNAEPEDVEPRDQAAAETKGVEAKDDTAATSGDRTAQGSPADKAERLDPPQPAQTAETAPPGTSDRSASMAEHPDTSPTSPTSPTSRTEDPAPVPPAFDKVEDKPADTPTGPAAQDTPNTPENKAERLDPPQPPRATKDASPDTSDRSESVVADHADTSPTSHAEDSGDTPGRAVPEPAAETASEPQAGDQQHPLQSPGSPDAAAPPGGKPPAPPGDGDGPPGNDVEPEGNDDVTPAVGTGPDADIAGSGDHADDSDVGTDAVRVADETGAASGVDHAARSTAPDGSPWPESPLSEIEPLPSLDEAEIGRDEKGLIDSIDGQPVDAYVQGLTDQRAESYLEGWRDGDIRATEVKPVFSVLLDTGTGRLYEAVNQPGGEIPNDLHPVLQERLDGLREFAAANPDAYRYPRGDTGSYPHFDTPGTHAEVQNVSRALYDREAMGYEVTPETLGEMLIDNRFPYGKDPGKAAPCCPNCTAVLGGVQSIPGMLDVDKFRVR